MMWIVDQVIVCHCSMFMFCKCCPSTIKCWPGCLDRRPFWRPSPACSSPPYLPTYLGQTRSLWREWSRITTKEFRSKRKITCCQERGSQSRCTVDFELLQHWPRTPRSSSSRPGAKPWEMLKLLLAMRSCKQAWKIRKEHNLTRAQIEITCSTRWSMETASTHSFTSSCWAAVR